MTLDFRVEPTETFHLLEFELANQVEDIDHFFDELDNFRTKIIEYLLPDWIENIDGKSDYFLNEEFLGAFGFSIGLTSSKTNNYKFLERILKFLNEYYKNWSLELYWADFDNYNSGVIGRAFVFNNSVIFDSTTPKIYIENFKTS